ncbi:isoprenoid synthase domain-containing protein [Fusarium tricinctum]|uniref:Terpene synthase n=1 Tax=Fusarium tricinctum TaxID=61284 RepID=A0A8K0RMY7_9HYPO|nr:isoprenoid synthase domain-containing protein [Fusarium tricinctum]
MAAMTAYCHLEWTKIGHYNTEGRWIKLPEALFASIMAVEPKINPMYKISKALSDDWLRDALRMDDITASSWSRLDIAYMSAICASNADIETLKLMNDWNGWVFAFDDPFDEGIFTNDPIKAAEEVIYTLATLDNIHPTISPEDNPLRHTLQSCWVRFSQRSSPALQYRWKHHLTVYCIGVLQQVGIQQRASRPTVEEYMNVRAGCVGAYPCIGLMELAEGIDLPQNVMNHPSLEAISRITCDLDQGLTDQQAVDQIGEMLYNCYRRWHAALNELTSWGEAVDRDVMKFVNGCRNVALGNLHWSLSTFRYLGNDGPEVKRTRMVKLP